MCTIFITLTGVPLSEPRVILEKTHPTRIAPTDSNLRIPSSANLTSENNYMFLALYSNNPIDFNSFLAFIFLCPQGTLLQTVMPKVDLVPH